MCESRKEKTWCDHKIHRYSTATYNCDSDDSGIYTGFQVKKPGFLSKTEIFLKVSLSPSYFRA